MIDGIENLLSWIKEHGSNIIRILYFAILYYFIYRIAVWRLVQTIVKKSNKKRDIEVVKQRTITVRDVLLKTGQIIFFFGVVMALLREGGANIAPLFAGFGVVGIAIGLGAQSLIKDIVNGLFIIGEGQYSKGDIIEIGDKKGKVEDVHLRKTVLRDLDGTVHHIPNSLVGIVSNKSQDWASINLDVKVSVSSDVDRVISLIEKAGRNLFIDKEFSSYMMEEPTVLGLDKIEDGKIVLKIIGKTKHLRRWQVERELLMRIKNLFDKEKVELV